MSSIDERLLGTVAVFLFQVKDGNRQPKFIVKSQVPPRILDATARQKMGESLQPFLSRAFASESLFSRLFRLPRLAVSVRYINILA